jgi:hypothetical protein
MQRFPSTLLVVLAIVAMTACESSSTIGNPATNLLKRVDTERDAVNGLWEMRKGILVSEVTPNARLALPAMPHGDYALTMRFSRVVGQGSAHFILPVGNAQVMLVLDAGPPETPHSGLELVGGQASDENPTTDLALDLVNHRDYRLDVTVRTRGTDARVDVDLDRRPFIRWRGEQSDLSVPGGWSLGEAALGVGSDDTVIEVRVARLRMLPGEVSWTD